ncbi:MAG: hypothetical protein JOY54_16720 [Acidobacteriaceae bacterium]|nr:hypothetical protein [Acidobacteriaceae bacterium]
MNRRELLRQGTQAAAGLCASAFSASALAAPLPGVPLSEFSYTQVQLADSPAQRQFEENQRLLLELSENTLLRPFRIREGPSLAGTRLLAFMDIRDEQYSAYSRV